MKPRLRGPRCAVALGSLLAALAAPAAAVDPDCIPLGPLASPPQLLQYCNFTIHPDHEGAVCDLGINSWSPPGTTQSSDIRIGDPFGAGTEDPRFFLDTGNPSDPTDDKFFTKLYSQLWNLGSGLAPSQEVTVRFYYKNGSDPTVGGWLLIGTYQMHHAVNPDNTLDPGLLPHQQGKPVCWDRAPTDPKQFLIRAVVSWPDGPDGNTANNEAISLYDMSAVERRAQIGFALDLSGSMSAMMPSGTSTRLDIAKYRAMQFVDLVESGNQLGVYGFATGNGANSTVNNVTYKDAANGDHTINLTDTSAIWGIQDVSCATPAACNLVKFPIKLSILGQSAHGCTPIGQGLLRAKHAIEGMTPPTSTAAKAIVLFSDGFQNVRPFVNSAPPYDCGGTAPALISAANTFSDYDIYSIHFGPETGWAFDLMNQIKDQTGGDFVFGASNGLELASVYYAIRGLVDDMIYLDEAGTVSAGAPAAPFSVDFDSAADVATVTVAWPWDGGDTGLAVDYRQQGERAWQTFADAAAPAGGTIAMTNATALSTAPGLPDLPYRVYRFQPGANTTWEFRVRQLSPTQGGTSYAAAVFSEVEQLQLLPRLDDEGFTAGDPLPIVVELRSGGFPVAGATVGAAVRVPTRAFSTTLRGYSGRFSLPPGPDPDSKRIQSMAQQLAGFLKADTGSADLYTYKQVPVALHDDGTGGDASAGDGIYTGVLPGAETRVAGDYEMTVSARGTLPSGRTVERLTKMSTIANVGPADPGLSSFELLGGDPAADGSRVLLVRIQPTDKYGNAAFPGSGRRLAVGVTGGSLSGGLVDGLDGTFSQEVFVPAGSKAKVDVSFGGGDMGSKPVDDEVAAAEREFSIHLGTALPHGAFGRVFSSGPSLGLDFAKALRSGLYLRVELDFNQFDDNAGGDRRLTDLVGLLQHRWSPSGLWTPYVEGGLGIYHLEGASTTAGGFSLGLGAYRALNPSWDLDLNLRSHRVGGALDLAFSQVRLGVIRKF